MLRARQLAPRLLPLVVVLLLGGGVAFYVLSAESLPVTAADRAVTVMAADLRPWLPGFEPKESDETLRKLRYLDGTLSLEYEFAPEDEDQPYVTSSVDVVDGSTDAEYTLIAVWHAMTGVIALDGTVTIQRDDERYRWGDESRFAALVVDGEDRVAAAADGLAQLVGQGGQQVGEAGADQSAVR